MTGNKIDAPRIVETAAERYALLHLVIPRSEMHAALPPALAELFAEVKAQGLPILPWFAHHLALTGANFDFEACIPVADTFVPTNRIGVATWPAGTVARTFYHGGYPGLPAAWKEFAAWIDQQGHTRASHIYERYTLNRGNTANPADYRTELTWPLL